MEHFVTTHFDVLVSRVSVRNSRDCSDCPKHPLHLLPQSGNNGRN